jgi:arsenite/tail-anchored protein-transporting ATPase
MQDLLNKRVLLVTGKGGVGRSSVTAAIARVGASRGKRVLVTEVDTGDDYSALARLFGRERFDESITELEKGIRATALTPRRGHELFMATVLRSETLAKKLVGAESLRRFAEATPSFRELGIFFHFLTLIKALNSSGSREHELIIVDMPATGHALALTGLPEIILGLVRGGPVATAIREGQQILNDAQSSSTLVVTLPESLPVTEALELIEGLQRTHMPVGGVILNRMPVDPFSAQERALLEPLLKANLHLGAGDFHHFTECFKARSRLSAGINVPMVVLSERSDPESLLVELTAELGELGTVA